VRQSNGSYGSDNHAGAHDAVLQALNAANDGPAAAYGGDPWTVRATEQLQRHVGDDVEILFALTGTGANVLSLATLLRPHEAVLCASSAHLNTDECGAPERFTGSKLLAVHAADGKLTPHHVLSSLEGLGGDYRVRPRVVSISQSTELGTVYTPEEIRALADVAHEHGLLLHVDGARLSNAAAALDVPLRALTRDVGVDAFTIGGTKNGLLSGEAVCIARELGPAARFVRKQAGQTASKMRFVSAQFEALYTDDLWLRNAQHANAMARRLADHLAGLPSLHILHPVQANAVFASVPPNRLAPLHQLRFFHDWSGDAVRWMTSFATTADDVDDFAAGIRRALTL
jgi:threonine aldolase